MLIQLNDIYGYPIGLYKTEDPLELPDLEQIFAEAIEESPDDYDNILSTKNIERVFVEHEITVEE